MLHTKYHLAGWKYLREQLGALYLWINSHKFGMDLTRITSDDLEYHSANSAVLRSTSELRACPERYKFDPRSRREFVSLDQIDGTADTAETRSWCLALNEFPF